MTTFDSPVTMEAPEAPARDEELLSLLDNARPGSATPSLPGLGEDDLGFAVEWQLSPASGGSS